MRDEKAVVEIILKGAQPNATLKEIEKSAAALRAQLRRLPTDSKEFEEKTKELSKVNQRLNKIREDIKGTGNMFQWLGKELKAFGIIAVAALGFQWLTGQVNQIIRGNAELSDSLADLRKTTGMTAAEARATNTAFSQMDTRTATKELRSIAIAAGQLGIAKNDIIKFTAATDKMVVALGDEFQGGASEVTKVMGGLRTIFSDIKTDKIDEDLLHIGNAVNVLASTGAATGPILTDFANRIGGVANTLGFTSAQTLGLSATLEELKVGTEKGGTAVVKILQRMTTHVAEFAKVADMDVQSFANLVNNDLYGAFTKVIEGSQKSGTNAVALGTILDNLGVDGAGASEVMTKLGGNMALLHDRVNLAGSALKSTDSIMDEFNIKNKTLGADMDRLGKNLNAWFTNSAVSNGLKVTIGWLAKITDRTKALSQVMADERAELMRTEAEILSYNVGNENRTKLIKELQDKYPDYLGNIDAEKVSHEDLSRAIAKVNNNLVNKIVIQQQDEKLAEQAEKQAEAAVKAATTRMKVLQDMANIYAQNQSNLYKGARLDLKKYLAGLPLDVQAKEMFEGDNYNRAGLSRYNKDIISLKDNYHKWQAAEVELATAKHESNKIDKEKQRLLEALGITIDQTVEKTKEATSATKPGDGTFVDPNKLKEAEAALKKHQQEVANQYQDLKNQLRAIGMDNSLSNLTEMEQEMAKIYRADEELRDKILANEMMNGDERKNALATLEENTQHKLNAVKLKYQKQAIKEAEEHKRQYNELTNRQMENELADVQAAFDKEIEFWKDDALKKMELEENLQLQLAAIRKKYAEKKEADEKTSTAKIKKNYREYVRSVEEMTNNLVQLQQMRAQQDIVASKNKYDSDVAREQRLLDRKIISQDDYNVRLQKLDDERRNRERIAQQKALAQEKQAALFSAGINAAEAITRILSKYAAAPWTAAALTALAVGTSATQIALINARSIPAYAGGGMHTAEGYTSGPALFASSTGRPFIAGEAGQEYIISQPMLQNGWIANQVGIMEAMRTGRTFADGGYSGKGMNEGLGAFNEKIAMMLEMNLAMMQKLSNEGVPAYLNYDVYSKTLSSIDHAKRSSQIG